LLLAVLPVIGTTAFMLLCFERIGAELQRVATTDALTGLPNRRSLGARANALFAQDGKFVNNSTSC
jgi:GGDEF domain-containing protein